MVGLMGKGRGGPSPRAGAKTARKRGGQPGNMNAAKNMQWSREPDLRQAMRCLPRAIAERVTKRMQAKDPEAWAEMSLQAAQWALEDNGLYVPEPKTNTPAGAPLADQPSIHQHHQHQSQRIGLTAVHPDLRTIPPRAGQAGADGADGAPGAPHLTVLAGGEEVLDKTVQRLDEWGFRPGPRNWMRLHREWIDLAIEYLDMLDAMSDEDLREYDHPMKLLNGSVHVAIAVLNEAGNAMVCPRFPLCKWRRDGRQLAFQEEKRS